VCQPSSGSNKSSSDIGPSPKGEEASFPSDETEVHNISSPNRLTSKKPHSLSEQELLFTSPTSFFPALVSDQGKSDMDNFEADPIPFIPDGMNVEEWARPPLGRIIITTNPPRRHDEYAIVSIDPPLQPNLLYETIDEVVAFFEDFHRMRIRSCCLSPLGLCLIQFPSDVARQALINLSLMHLDNGNVITVVEHDRGINLRNCPFTRTCWICFLLSRWTSRPEKLFLRLLGFLALLLPGLTTPVSDPEFCFVVGLPLSAESPGV
jgi:hypothetical protein